LVFTFSAIARYFTHGTTSSNKESMTLKKDVIKDKKDSRPSRKGVIFREQNKDWKQQVKEYKEKNANKSV